MDVWSQLQHFSQGMADGQALQLEPKHPALLSMMIVEARNLACLDAVPPLPPMKPHAYISCGLRNVLKVTQTAPQNTDPKFECVLDFGVVEMAPDAPPLLLNVYAVNATPFLQLTDSLGSAELDLSRLFACDHDLERLRAGAEGCLILRDSWVALEGAGTGEVHFRISLRSTDCAACDLSLNALALAEYARAGTRGHDGSTLSTQSLEMEALEQSTACHLELLEVRQFWSWVRALQANPWLVSEPDSHAMAQQRGNDFDNIVRAGLPGQRTVNRLLEQVVFVGDAGQWHAHTGQRQHMSKISAQVTGWRIILDQYALFRIEVTFGEADRGWVVWRRHSEFVVLGAELEDWTLDPRLAPITSTSTEGLFDSLSHHVLGSLSPTFLNRRQSTLNALLQKALASFSEPSSPHTTGFPHTSHNILTSLLGDFGGLIGSTPNEHPASMRQSGQADDIDVPEDTLHRNTFDEDRVVAEFLCVVVVDSQLEKPLNALRTQMWLILSGGARLKATGVVFSDSQAVSFSELRVAALSRNVWCDSLGCAPEIWDTCAEEAFLEIDQDLSRTTGAELALHRHQVTLSSNASDYGEGVRGELNEETSLQAVLRAAALALPNLGYCQSMTFIAHMFLRNGCDEEDALHLLLAVCTEVAPAYFGRSISTPDLFLLGRLLESRLPQTCAHISCLGATPEVLVSPWLFSFFTNGSGFPTQTLLRLWDWFLLEGPDVFLLALLTLFNATQADLASADALDECVAVLKTRASNWHDASQLINLAQKELEILGGESALVAARQSVIEELQSSTKADWIRRQHKDLTAQFVMHMVTVTETTARLTSTLVELFTCMTEASLEEEVGVVFSGENPIKVAEDLKHKFNRGRLHLLGQLPPLAVDAKRVRQIIAAQGLTQSATAVGLLEASMRFFLVEEDTDGHLISAAFFLATMIILSPLSRATKVEQIYTLALAASGQAEGANLEVIVSLLRYVTAVKLPELSNEDINDAISSSLQHREEVREEDTVLSSVNVASNTIDDASNGGDFANFYFDGASFWKEAKKVQVALDLVQGETLTLGEFESLILKNSVTRAVFND